MRISYDPGIPKWIQTLCQNFLQDWYNPQKHVNPIKVRVINAGYLVIPSCADAYGVFNVRGWPPRSRRAVAKIYIAGAWRWWACSKREAALELLDTLAHECVHYEKWLSGGSNTHRGVPQRVTKLVRPYLTRHLF